MLQKRWIPILFVTLVSSACQPAEEPTEIVSRDADAEAIRALVQQYDRSVNTANIDDFVAIFAADAVQMPPASQEFTGAQNIGARLEIFLEENSDELVSEVQEINFYEDAAVVRLTYTESWTPKAGGESVHIVGKGFQFVEKQSDGTWKITREIWNEDNPRIRN